MKHAYARSRTFTDWRMVKEGELERLTREIRSCLLCDLSKTRNKAVPGEGRIDARIMFVGQAPGREEDSQGRPFVGRAGRFLNGLLSEIGVKREDVYITSVVKCYPPRNRLPRKGEIEACRPYLSRQLELIDPEIVVLLGGVAVETLLGMSGLKGAVGRTLRRGGRRLFVTYHPAAGMRFPRIRRAMEEHFEQLRVLIGG
ncbi:MAG: uracil-DNA glycosylase [Candidatus Bathyarchaeia archaeon]